MAATAEEPLFTDAPAVATHLDACMLACTDGRARRLACIPRLRAPMSLRDLALNRAEILRVVGTGNLYFDSAPDDALGIATLCCCTPLQTADPSANC